MEELTLERLAARLAEVEQSNARLQHSNGQLTNELKLLRLAQQAHSEATADPQQQASRQSKHAPTANANSPRKSRRTLLRQGLGVAAAVVGVGALAEMSTDQALAGGHPRHHVVPNDNLGVFSSSDGVHPAVSATGTDGSDGVDASSDSGYGVKATSATTGKAAMYAVGTNGATGVYSLSDSGVCVFGHSSGTSGYGVLGDSNGTSGYGVGGYGNGPQSVGVFGGGVAYGVWGVSSGTGVLGQSIDGVAVVGDCSGSGTSVHGQSHSGNGVFASSYSGEAIFAQSTLNNAIHAISGGATTSAVFAEGGSGTGVTATSSSGNALGVNGTIQVSGPVGQATLPAGQKSVNVPNSAATPNSNVLLTSLNNYTGTVWVTRASGNFTINISSAQESDVVFTYLLIN